MNYSGTAFGAARQRRAAGHQGVYQRVVPVARRRVNDQSGGFVYDGEVFVFEDQREGNSGGPDGAGRLVRRDLNGDALSSGQEPRRAGRLPFNRDEFAGHQASRLSSGQPHLVGQETIQPLGLRSYDGKLYLMS